MPARARARCSIWPRDVIHQALAHDSAALHVSGEARYVDDLPEPPGTLYAAFGMSTETHARILALDLAPVRAAEGVVAVLTAADIPGANNIGPVVADEPALATNLVQFRGQPLFAVAATRVELARRAARLARVEYERLDPVVTIEQALEANQFVLPSVRCERGSVASLPGAANRIRGRLRCGAQEHFYLEGQVALAIPGEGGEMLVHSSTQHPSEIQHLVAAALGVPALVHSGRSQGTVFEGWEAESDNRGGHWLRVIGRLAPGASYPAHTHAGVEELHLLDGELWIDEKKLVPGDYNYGAPGAGDERVWSETGCTCVLITSTEDILH